MFFITAFSLGLGSFFLSKPFGFESRIRFALVVVEPRFGLLKVKIIIILTMMN